MPALVLMHYDPAESIAGIGLRRMSLICWMFPFATNNHKRDADRLGYGD